MKFFQNTELKVWNMLLTSIGDRNVTTRSRGPVARVKIVLVGVIWISMRVGFVTLIVPGIAFPSHTKDWLLSMRMRPAHPLIYGEG